MVKLAATRLLYGSGEEFSSGARHGAKVSACGVWLLQSAAYSYVIKRQLAKCEGVHTCRWVNGTSLAITAFLMVRPRPAAVPHSFTTPPRSLSRGTAYSRPYPSLSVHSEPICDRTICDPYKQQPCELPRQTRRPLSADRFWGRRGARVTAHPLTRIAAHCWRVSVCATVPFLHGGLGLN